MKQEHLMSELYYVRRRPENFVLGFHYAGTNLVEKDFIMLKVQWEKMGSNGGEWENKLCDVWSFVWLFLNEL